MNFVDPSGHFACNDEGVCNSNPQRNTPSQGGLPSGKLGGGDEGSGSDDEDSSPSLDNIIDNEYEEFSLTTEEASELSMYYENLQTEYLILGLLTGWLLIVPQMGFAMEAWIGSNVAAANSMSVFFAQAEQAAAENGGNITIRYYQDANSLDPKGTPGMPAVTIDGSRKFTEIWSLDLGYAVYTQLEDPAKINNNLPVYVRYNR
jgi:hypothetical protein